jgi:hypothetical protein
VTAARISPPETNGAKAQEGPAARASTDTDPAPG